MYVHVYDCIIDMLLYTMTAVNLLLSEKSSDFDLFFHGLNGSSTTTSIPVEGEMSFCLWIRSFNTGQNKTILTLAM